MHYEISVSKRFLLFRTYPTRLMTEDTTRNLLAIMREHFPESSGYTVAIYKIQENIKLLDW